MFFPDKSVKGLSGRRGPAPRSRRTRGGAGVSDGGEAPGSTPRAGGAGAGSGRDQVVEQARQEREQREWRRKMGGKATQIQCMWRGHASRAATANQWSAELSQKLTDVEGVSQAFQTAGIPFVPPAATAHELLRELNGTLRVGAGRRVAPSPVRSLLPRLCRLVLLPSASSSEAALNLLSDQALSSPPSASTAPVGGVVGGDAAAPEWPSWLSCSKARLRGLCMACLAACEHSLREVDGSLAARGAAAEPLPPSDEDPRLAMRVLSAIMGGAVPVVSPEARDTLESSLSAALFEQGLLRRALLALPEPHPTPYTPRQKEALQDLWALSLDILRRPSLPDRALYAFARLVLSVPLLSWREDGVDRGRIPTASLVESIAHPDLWYRCAKALLETLETGGRLPEAALHGPLAAVPATAWTLGNVVVFFRRSFVVYGGLPAVASSVPQVELLARLFDEAPLGVLSDTAAVSWQSKSSGIHTPVIISPALLCQVRSLVDGRSATALVDALVRQHFLPGLDLESIEVMTKEDTDEETRLLRGASAQDMAHFDSRHRKPFASRWLDSTWAHRAAINLQKGASKLMDAMMGSSAPSAAATESRSGLINTTGTARAAAEGDLGPAAAAVAAAETGASQSSRAENSRRTATRAPRVEGALNVSAVRSLATLFSTLFRRWLPTSMGGAGTKFGDASRDLVGTPRVFWLLHSLALSSVVSGRPPIIRGLWVYLQRPTAAPEKGDAAVAGLLCGCLSQLLVVLDHTEMYEDGKPLPPHQLRRLVRWLKDIVFQAVWNGGGLGEAAASRDPEAASMAYLRTAASRALRDLYDRSSRRAFVDSRAWLVSQAEGGRVLAEVQAQTPRGWRLLTTMPYAIPFVERLKLLRQLVDTEKASTQASGAPGVRVRIRRVRVLEDGLRELNGLRSHLKKKLIVEYINQHGLAEDGIDAGGLFKEFWTDLSALAFNMDFGLFKTTAEGFLYPNPASAIVQGPEHTDLFAFLGRVLGKAIYEGITVEPKFAHFFLSYLKGNYNYLHTWHDLSTLDAELYRNLMFLKTYEGDAADLCLTFTVADDSFGGTGGEVELVHGGARLEVTNRNKREYIERVANYLLVKRLETQAAAFRHGLADILDLQWLKMFNEPELQVLISGAPTAIDLGDLKRNCRYNGFTALDRTVQRFWKVVATLDPDQQAKLLRFVTSCQRPPPLGFEALTPKFMLQRISIRADDDRLPTAATCFNTLKLPTYSSESVLRKKLLLAINSNSGFNLT